MKILKKVVKGIWYFVIEHRGNRKSERILGKRFNAKVVRPAMGQSKEFQSVFFLVIVVYRRIGKKNCIDGI